MVTMAVKRGSIKALEAKMAAKKFKVTSKQRQYCNGFQNIRSICGTANTPNSSPEKALRAAILKKRFADTIFKATNQQVLNNVTDPVMRQKEKERLEKEQKQELAKINAQIKAAETASRLKEREAARKALDNVKKTVDFNDYANVLDDLEMMGFRRSDFE